MPVLGFLNTVINIPDDITLDEPKTSNNPFWATVNFSSFADPKKLKAKY